MQDHDHSSMVGYLLSQRARKEKKNRGKAACFSQHAAGILDVP
jgi:hypothetical protein